VRLTFLFENQKEALERHACIPLEPCDELVLNEQPPKSTGLHIDQVTIYNPQNNVIVAQVSKGDQSGLLRLSKTDSIEDWTTDNIEMFNHTDCESLSELEPELLSLTHSVKNQKDSGRLPYDLMCKRPNILHAPFSII